MRSNQVASKEYSYADVDTQQSTEVELINDTKLLEQFAEMAVMIPADLGSGTEDILRKILSATTWDQLDEPWETSDIEDILGKTLRLTKVTRRPSTFKGGLGVFLVMHIQDAKTGKEYVKTTGSVSVVGQIARAYAMGVTALTFEWCRAERPSENGYYPQHLKILDAATPDGSVG
jgi:hypothetical protein